MPSACMATACAGAHVGARLGPGRAADEDEVEVTGPDDGARGGRGITQKA